MIELLVERHLLAGQVHEGRGRPADARRDFRLVRQLDPDRRELDAGAYRPQVVALFAEAATDERRRGALRIDTEPPGARVFGRRAIRRRGAARGRERRLPARHWVVAAAPGHRPRGAIVDVEAREQAPHAGAGAAARRPSARPSCAARCAPRPDRRAPRRRRRAGPRRRGATSWCWCATRDGQVEGAVFDARRRLLSGWLAVPSEPFSRRIAAAASPDLAGADPGAGASLAGRPCAPRPIARRPGTAHGGDGR